jgi:hypothetical protein
VWLWFVLPHVDVRSLDLDAPPGDVRDARAFTLYVGASVAFGQPPAEQFVFEVPPAPEQAEALFTFDVHTGFFAPVVDRALCPAGAGCVLKSGGGVGGSAERRWPAGWGVFVGYDLWFLDTDSVYELGVQQILRAGARYTMPTSVVFHPVFELGSGVMTYGDTFRVATVGGVIELLAGSEFELSAAFGLRAGLGYRAFSHSAFRTQRDGVLRGKGGVFSQGIFLQVGLTFL